MMRNALHIAPKSADNANTFLGLNRSATPKYALIKAPVTNPIGTDAVNQASELGVIPQKLMSSGATTEALNHKLSAHISDKLIHINALHDCCFIILSLFLKDFNFYHRLSFLKINLTYLNNFIFT